MCNSKHDERAGDWKYKQLLHDKIICRQADKTDLPGVLCLYAQPELDNGRVLSLETAEQLFERMQNYPDYHLHVALCNNQVVGTFALLIMDNLGHLGASSAVIEDVAVAPAWQGRGVGSTMMRYALQICSDKGCYKAVLSSSLKRYKAHAFYEAIGFERHGYSYLAQIRP